jgi:hypothetical protein
LDTIFRQKYFYALVNKELKWNDKYKKAYDDTKDKTLADFVKQLKPQDQEPFLTWLAQSL